MTYDSEKERKDAIRRSKTKYMLKTLWFCDLCLRKYQSAGKFSHIKTKKHKNYLHHLNNVNNI